jgi:hypothetical protein
LTGRTQLLQARPQELGAERLVQLDDDAGQPQFLGEGLFFGLPGQFAPERVAGQGQFERPPGPLGCADEGFGQSLALVGERLDEEVHGLLSPLTGKPVALHTPPATKRTATSESWVRIDRVAPQSTRMLAGM